VGHLVKNKRILQIGFGAFGAVHARAWLRLSPAALIVADPSDTARAAAQAQFPEAQTVANWTDRLSEADIVDIVAPTHLHATIARAAIEAGKPLFIEKPATADAREALSLWRLLGTHDVACQVGMFFRHHPMALDLKRQVAAGAFGRLRYFSGRFAGLKRARTDAGALLNDAVHFIDLANWLFGRRPLRIFAVCRDHFGRGMEDLAVLHLLYDDGANALIECGYIQPGRWPDAVVPGAITSKEIALCGSAAVADVDFAGGRYELRRGAHREAGGQWQPDYGPATSPVVVAADVADVVAAEIGSFATALESGAATGAGFWDCGVIPALIIEAAQRSAASGEAVNISYPEGDA